MANVLSMSSRHAVRHGRCRRCAGMSSTSRLGLPIVSARTSRVSGRIAAAKPAWSLRCDEGCVDAEAGQRSREEVDGSAIERGRRDDMIAGARQRNDGEMHRRHAASRRHRADPALKRGEPLLEDRRRSDSRCGCRCGRARSKIEQRRRMFRVAIDVGRRLVDRDGAGAVVWIRPLPSMEGERVKSWGPRSCHINDSAQAHAPARGGTAGAGERGFGPATNNDGGMIQAIDPLDHRAGLDSQLGSARAAASAVRRENIDALDAQHAIAPCKSFIG